MFLVASLLFCRNAGAQTVDFTKAIRVETGIYAGSYGFGQRSLYAVHLDKGAELVGAASVIQRENEFKCGTNYHFVIYDAFKREVKKSYKYFSRYLATELFTDNLNVKAETPGLYYVYLIAQLDPDKLVPTRFETICKPRSGEVMHDVTLSIEVKGNRPTGPQYPPSNSKRQCARTQKNYCQANGYRRKWTETKVRQCITKRKGKYCGL